VDPPSKPSPWLLATRKASPVRIGFLLRAPTQFEAPFLRYVSGQSGGDIKAFYTKQGQLTDDEFDPEIGTKISWGIDLTGGYASSVVPPRRRLRWFARELRHYRYDLLVVSGYRGVAPLAATAAAKLVSIPVALRLDTPAFAFQVEGRAKRWLRRLLYALFRRLYDHFLPVGSSAAELLTRLGVEPDRISPFPYTVDLDRFRQGSRISAPAKRELRRSYGLPDDEPVVMAVTKFSAREAPWDLVRAYCSMDQPGACLWLLGDGPERQALQSYVRDHGRDGVVFSGYWPYSELPTAYGLADAFVHPARYEPWGASVQEALASGLPVLLSSMVGAGRDFVTPGKNGFIYRSGDVEDLRNKLPLLLGLISSPELAATTEGQLTKCSYDEVWQTITAVARGGGR
jgi:glycosyltransferase involved in cell wall biosynthesis